MKTTRLSLLLPAVVSAALLAGCADRDIYLLADTDGDGKVSQAEFERFMLEAIFTEADADGDGKVTYAEHKAANPSIDAARSKAIDANGDGVITPAEAKAYSDKHQGLAQLFAKIDTDKDGYLSRSEVETFYTVATESAGSTRLEKLSNAANQ